MSADVAVLYPADRAPGRDESPVALAEQRLVGSALLNPRVLDEVDLNPADIYHPTLERVWALMQSEHAQGRTVDTMAVSHAAKRAGIIGVDPARLHDLTRVVVVASTVLAADDAREIAAAAASRRVMAVAQRLAQDVAEGRDADEIVEAARTDLERATVGRGAGHLVPLHAAMEAGVEAATSPHVQTTTPWRGLDEWIGGWRPGRMYVIGARPGSGKSIFGLNAATHMAAVTGRHVAISSLEMDSAEIGQRAIAAVAGVNFFNLQNNKLDDAGWDSVRRAISRATSSPGQVYVDDRASVRPADVRAHARKVAHQGSLGMVVVDYLQLMENRDRSESRQQDVSGFSRAMKNMARDLHVPVLVLSQLNRAVEGRTDGPRLSDLRESGSLEQDADVVALLHHDSGEHPDADKLKVHVAKNRQGPQGKCQLRWQARHMRVTDW